jgi:hypothetical protein
MLWIFATVGLTGILCGCLFRAPALVLLSFISFGAALPLSLLGGSTLGGAFLNAVLVAASLQVGYLIGAGLTFLWQQLRHRLSQRGALGRDYDGPLKRHAQQPIAHR